jgi:peptidoglycan hydrolase-like protein with peptidoglycan-binding domain
VFTLVVLLAGSQAWAAVAKTKKHATSSKTVTSNSTKKVVKKGSRKSSRRAKGRRSRRPRGQQAIQAARVREIQEALIKAHYLDGKPSGVWDTQTKDAMKNFQGDNGWQTKVLPDSRALIKLGLGPNHDGLLNPESAAVSPHELSAEKEIPGGSVEAK